MESRREDVPASGSGAAALLAAAIGGFTLGICAFAGDAMTAIGHALNLWNPTGPLSGVTTVAILVWLVAWIVLSRLWASRTIDQHRINLISAALFVLGLLLTFPPCMDLLQGK